MHTFRHARWVYSPKTGRPVHSVLFTAIRPACLGENRSTHTKLCHRNFGNPQTRPYRTTKICMTLAWTRLYRTYDRNFACPENSCFPTGLPTTTIVKVLMAPSTHQADGSQGKTITRGLCICHHHANCQIAMGVELVLLGRGRQNACITHLLSRNLNDMHACHIPIAPPPPQ